MATVALTPDLHTVGARTGFVFALGACGVLLGQPVAGTILKSTGSYLGLQCRAAAGVSASAIFLPRESVSPARN